MEQNLSSHLLTTKYFPCVINFVPQVRSKKEAHEKYQIEKFDKYVYNFGTSFLSNTNVLSREFSRYGRINCSLEIFKKVSLRAIQLIRADMLIFMLKFTQLLGFISDVEHSCFVIFNDQISIEKRD